MVLACIQQNYGDRSHPCAAHHLISTNLWRNSGRILTTIDFGVKSEFLFSVSRKQQTRGKIALHVSSIFYEQCFP